MSTALATRPVTIDSIFFSPPAVVLDQMEAIENEIARSVFGYSLQWANRGTPLDNWLRAESNFLKPVQVSIDEQSDRLTVKADMPGFSPEEIKVSVEDGILRICGKSEQKKEEKTAGNETKASSSERKICCKIALPAKVETKRASASLAKGVLTLNLPKTQTSSTSQIEVKAA